MGGLLAILATQLRASAVRFVKILLISWYFPPSRTIAAVRLGKLAHYLLAQGHDVRVLTPRDPPLPQDLTFDFPAERVVRSAWGSSKQRSSPPALREPA